MNQNICLCYNNERGIHTRNCRECDDTIFTIHEHKGYYCKTLEIPQENIRILIKSNFGFGSNSFLYAVIERDGTRILDFSKEKLRVLNYSSVKNFTVETEDWDTLLRKIATACSTLTPRVCPTTAIDYLDELHEILNNDSVEIKGAFHDEHVVKWEDKFLIMLLVGDKLKDLFNGLQESQIEDEVLNKHLLSFCRLFLSKLRCIKIGYDDNRTIRLAETLYEICKFMGAHNAEIEFMQLYLKANHDKDCV